MQKFEAPDLESPSWIDLGGVGHNRTPTDLLVIACHCIFTLPTLMEVGDAPSSARSTGPHVAPLAVSASIGGLEGELQGSRPPKKDSLP